MKLYLIQFQDEYYDNISSVRQKYVIVCSNFKEVRKYQKDFPSQDVKILIADCKYLDKLK